MGLNITQINPQETMRKVLLDPMAAQAKGYIALECFDPSTWIDTAPKPEMPGLLSGTIRIRDPRNVLRASAGQALKKAIGAPRTSADRYEDLTVNFNCAQVDGFNEELIANTENALLRTADEERMLFEVARAGHDIKLERWCSTFFTRIAGEATTDGVPVPGWREVNWTGAGNTALNSSNVFLQQFGAVYDAAVLAARGKKPTAIFIPAQVGERFQRDPTFLGRQVQSIATGNGSAIAMVGGSDSVAPLSHVEAVLRDHFGFTKVLFGRGTHDNTLLGTAENTTYIWPNNRLWMGHVAPAMVDRSAGTPRVVASGAYAMVVNKIAETITGPDKLTDPQYQQFIMNSYLDMVVLMSVEGTIIHTLN